MCPGNDYNLEDVFTPGKQPTVTYVAREDLGIERNLARGIARPAAIVSLTGATKSGKTVLCRNVLGDRHYVWIEAGQVKNQNEFWDRVCYELNFPIDVSIREGEQSSLSTSIGGEAEFGSGFFAKLKTIVTASGSQLSNREVSRQYKINSVAQAISHLVGNHIALVIDDFHYIPDEERRGLLRSLRGAIFQGLKVILLSVTYRAFDALQTEPELTGRLVHIEVPDWDERDLSLIAEKGFGALNVNCPATLVQELATEANGSPLLMQSFCWELCYDLGIQRTSDQVITVRSDLDLKDIFYRVAKDSGQPIYEKLAAGPVTRTPRIDRPLRSGGAVDIYKALLFAIAATGPKSTLSYEEIRSSLSNVLSDKVPQRIEISNSLRQLARIAEESGGGQRPLDWNEETRTVHIADPYLQFFLRWQIRQQNGARGLFEGY